MEARDLLPLHKSPWVTTGVTGVEPPRCPSARRRGTTVETVCSTRFRKDLSTPLFVSAALRMWRSRFCAKNSDHVGRQVLSWTVSPQQVGTGKPKPFEAYSGGGGVVWSFASLAANDIPLPSPLLPDDLDDPLPPLMSRNSVARKYPSETDNFPHAKDLGARLGTALWIALSDACSPSNIVAAPFEEEVLMNMDVVGVVRRKDDVKPDEPWVEILRSLSCGVRERAERIDGSICEGVGMFVVGLVWMWMCWVRDLRRRWDLSIDFG